MLVRVPEDEGDRAGIVAFQNDDHLFVMAATLDSNGGTAIELVRRSAGHTSLIASAPIEVKSHAPVYLRIEADRGVYRFLYAAKPGGWSTLSDEVDGTILSTRVDGGFVGAMFGLYAHSDE